MKSSIQLMLKAPLLAVLLSACTVGHNDFIGFRNSMIGEVMAWKEPFKWENSGQLRRGDYLLSGEGLTHISKDSEGSLIYHMSGDEVLSNFNKKEWVGKCLTYYVVDPYSYVIKSWGFDEGGNPLSCRTWP